MKPEPLQQLKIALRERLEVIGDREAREKDPSAHLERLRHVSETITRLQSQFQADIDPRLDHFLKRCSYDKALALLDAI